MQAKTNRTHKSETPLRKTREQLEFQLDQLIEKTDFQAKRFNFDLSDDAVSEHLIDIANHSVDCDLIDKSPHSAWIERFLALAYVQGLIAVAEEDISEKIAALCLGNWLVGILGGMDETESESNICIPCIIKNHASQNGKIGAQKKNAAMRELEKWTVMQYRLKKWPSVNKAAHGLKDAVLDHGRNINAVLSEENAQRTIADWIRKANKLAA